GWRQHSNQRSGTAIADLRSARDRRSDGECSFRLSAGGTAGRRAAARRHRLWIRSHRDAARGRRVTPRCHRVSKDDRRARLIRGCAIRSAARRPRSASHSRRGAEDVSDASITQKLNTEGADLLTLAGVNDGNLVELSRIGGVKVALRGDTLSITGPLEFVERAADIARRMIETARQRLELSPDDVLRMSDDIDRRRTGGGGGAVRDNGDYGDDIGESNGAVGVDTQRIALPGIRRVIQAKTPGQAEYLRLIQDNDIVVGIGPAGTGKTYLAVAAAVDALTRKRVRR